MFCASRKKIAKRQTLERERQRKSEERKKYAYILHTHSPHKREIYVCYLLFVILYEIRLTEWILWKRFQPSALETRDKLF